MNSLKFPNNRLNSWLYNVADHFKDKTTEEINDILRETANPFSVLMENWQGDFNISTMIRNANAFNARKVFYLGRKKFDRRGTVGTHHYVDLNFLRTHDELKNLKDKFTFVCMDNVPGSVPIEDFVWPENPLIIFGEEGAGITQETLAMADHVVSITQFGSVRSMNVGTASGIAMYDFMRKHNENKERRSDSI